MNDFTAIIDSIALNASRSNPPVDGDYTGEDGLLYCGKCHTRKQTRLPMTFGGRIVACSCLCKQREWEEEKEREKQKRADELRAYCLPDIAMRRRDELGEEKIRLAKELLYKSKE